MPEVFVGAGSNVDPASHLRAGLVALAERYGLLRVSPVYRNSAVGFEGEDFLNMVIAFDTDEPVGEVCAFLAEVESANGRTRAEEKFSPRTLDLDLLMHGNSVGHIDGVELPRSEITRYAFVLKPLADLAPESPHPVEGNTFSALWAGFDQAAHPLEPVSIDFTEDPSS
jgi:2-amino-4-hydroxy-6-hydroxymethyldihydropteridine diphosphokinase